MTPSVFGFVILRRPASRWGLERKVAALVCRTVESGGVCCRSSRCLCRGRLCYGSGGSHGSSRCGYCTLLYAPSTDRSVPTPVEFAGFYIERDRNNIVYLARVGLNTLLAEEFETYLTRVLFLRLEDIRLRLPWVARFARTALLGKYLNDFTYNIHCVNKYI